MKSRETSSHTISANSKGYKSIHILVHSFANKISTKAVQSPVYTSMSPCQ